jgi:hypothetical protein
MLRAQQWLGPIYDLGPSSDRESYSDVVNHRPEPEWKFTLPSPTFGEHAGTTITYHRDENGVRVPHSVGTAENCVSAGTILFMGDSFMEGYAIADSIPDHVARLLAEKYGICARVLNAGYSSYSPAIFIPLARTLMKEISPSYVVVDVDETDLADDVVRYEKLITRNDRGENVGVRASPKLKEVDSVVEASGTRPLYLQRLADRLYIRFVVMPRFEADATDPFMFSDDLSPDAGKKLDGELSILRRNLTELVGVLSKWTGSPQRVVFIRHPHLEHLETPERPPIWSNLIGSTVGRTVTSLGASYVDATPELIQRFGGDPQRYYWPGDMHLNFKGLRQYSEVVAAFLARKIRSETPARPR